MAAAVVAPANWSVPTTAASIAPPIEVSVEDCSGLPDSSIISIRCGATRRQAPLESLKAHPLKFPPSSEATSEPLKIDVLQQVASGLQVLLPHKETYRIPLDGKELRTNGGGGAGIQGGGQMPVSLTLKVRDSCTNGKLQGPAPPQQLQQEPPSPSPKYKDAAAAARDYLDRHGLLRYMQALLHAVLQAKPEDPYSYMMDQLGSVPRLAEDFICRSPLPAAAAAVAAATAAAAPPICGQKEVQQQEAPEEAEAEERGWAPSMLLSPVQSPRRREDAPATIDELKMRMKTLFVKSYQSDALNGVLQSVHAQAANQADAGAEGAEGRQEDAPQAPEGQGQAKNGPGAGRPTDAPRCATPPEDPTVSRLKAKMREVLESSLDTGELARALQDSRPLGARERRQRSGAADAVTGDDAAEESRSFSGLRRQLRDLLLEAQSSGNLGRALEQAHEEEDFRQEQFSRLRDELVALQEDSQSLHTQVERLSSQMRELKHDAGVRPKP